MQTITDFEGFEIFISGIHDGDFHDPETSPDIHRSILQVHGTDIHIFTEKKENFSTHADGVYTREKGIIIGAQCADCPIIILMWVSECAVIHSGWRGSRLHIGQKAVMMMTTDQENIRAYIWPHIQRYSYEVQSDFLEYFPSEFFEKKDGKIFFDIGKYIIDDLIAVWLKAQNIIMSPIDTFSNPSYHSYRRDRGSGRGIVGVRILEN